MSESPEEKRSTVSVLEDLRRRLKTLAASRGDSVQEHADEALRRYLAQEAGGE